MRDRTVKHPGHAAQTDPPRKPQAPTAHRLAPAMPGIGPGSGVYDPVCLPCPQGYSSGQISRSRRA